MFRLIKWLLGFLVTLVTLVLAAVIIVPMVFDPNDYRDEIAALVKEKTGRDLSLTGELSVSVFPWVGIRTEGLSLSQPSQIGGDMVSVETAQLRVKFAPLLSKQVHIDTVVLEQPTLRLVTLASGVDSFYGLTGDESSPQAEGSLSAEGSQSAEGSPQAESSSDAGAGVAVALVIQGVELSDGQLLVEDRATGSVTEVSKLNLETGNLIGSELADIIASGQLKTSDSPDVILFTLTGKAQINADTLQVDMADLTANVTQSGQDVTLAFNAMSFTNSANIELAGLQITMSGVADAVLGMPTLSANLDSQQAEIPRISIQAGSLKAELVNLRARRFIDAPSATGRLTVLSFDAANLLREFDIEYQTSNPEALKNVALEADFSGSLDSAGIKNLLLTLDSSQLTGSASVRNFAQPEVTFDLNLNQLNVDHYLPPSDETGAEDEDAVSGADALAVPMAAFKDIQANGQFKAQTFISGGVEMNDIDVQVRSTPGNVTITPTASLYDGSLGGQIAFSEQGETSTLSVKNKMDLVQLGKLLNAADVTDQLSGIGSLLVDLVVTETGGVQTNQGVIKLLAKDGAVQGVDIKAMVDGAYAKYQSLRGDTSDPQAEPSVDTDEGQSDSRDETRFAEMLGTFNVNNNVITNDDFTLKAPLFRVGGAGTIDVAKQTLDYLVEVKLVASTDGQGGESIDKLAGIPIPIRLSGDLNAPSYSIDFKRMYKALFAAEIDRKKGELLNEKLGIEGGEKLSTKQVLRGLLGKEIDKKINKGNDDNTDQAQERPLTEQNAAQTSQGLNEQETAQEKKSEKDQLKEDLKNKLLDGLFGK